MLLLCYSRGRVTPQHAHHCVRTIGWSDAACTHLFGGLYCFADVAFVHVRRCNAVDDVLFKEYLARMVESATKLEELMAEYEELENSTPGVNRDRLHATVQQSVQLISHVKAATVHVALDGVGRWLKKQAYELERTQSELDTFEDAEVCMPQVGRTVLGSHQLSGPTTVAHCALVTHHAG